MPNDLQLLACFDEDAPVNRILLFFQEFPNLLFTVPIMVMMAFLPMSPTHRLSRTGMLVNIAHLLGKGRWYARSPAAVCAEVIR